MPSIVTFVNDGSPFQTTSGAALVSSAVLTDVSPVTIQIPAFFDWHTGGLFRFTAYGIMSTSSAAPTLTVALYAGSSATISSNTVLATSAAITTTASLSNNTWRAEFSTRVNAIGASGTTLTQGFLMLPTSATTGATSTFSLPSAASSTGGSATFLSGQANYIQLGMTWGTSSAANTLTCFQWYMEALDT